MIFRRHPQEPDEDCLREIVAAMPTEPHPSDPLVVEIAARLLWNVRAGRADGAAFLALVEILKDLRATPPTTGPR